MVYQAVLAIVLPNTLLLMCICRTLQGSPLMLSGVRLMLPQPEFDHLESSAQAASAFVVELLGTYVTMRHTRSHLGLWFVAKPTAPHTILVATAVPPHIAPSEWDALFARAFGMRPYIDVHMVLGPPATFIRSKSTA
jgi:hypothetical protein